MYRESGFRGTYKEYLKAIGYVTGRPRKVRTAAVKRKNVPRKMKRNAKKKRATV